MSLTKSPPLVYGAAPRVNLLPPAERERRERAALTRRWARIAAGAVLVVLLATAAMVLLEHSARAGLDRERDRTTALVQQLAHYRGVSTATQDRSRYQAYRTNAMATDLSWSDLFNALQAKVPEGAAITGFDAVTAIGTAGTAAGSGTAPSAAASAGATGAVAPPGTAVQLTLTVTSKRPLAQQALVAALEKVPGVLAVDLVGLSSESYPSYTATSTVFLDSSVYSRRYAEPKP